jgi:hypothetical protein
MPQLRFPTVINPVDGIMYVDNPYSAEPTYDIPLIDTKAFMGQVGGNSKAASTQHNQEIFYSNDRAEYNFEDIANQYYDKIAQARIAPTKQERLSKAAAVITSLDFADFQTATNTVIGQLAETPIRQGILLSLFETVAVPNLSGRFISFTNDLKYFRNIPESKSPEPSKGSGTYTTITVQKHGGAVAITQRAQAVINADNPFQRLVAQMAQKKNNDENAMMAAEIEGNTSHTYAGVDFGARTGSPPASTTNPIDMLNSTRTTFEALSQDINLFVSKGFMYWEYVTNDIVRGGVNNVPPSQGAANEQVGPFPGLDGVTWARDNAISSSTAGWAMNSSAIKNFRGPSRNYTIADEDTETTKYVTKNYYLPKTVDTTLVYEVTGIAA